MSNMNFIQNMRRLGQQMSGWNKAFSSQYSQSQLLQKLYANNGLELKMTCGACPEQYEVFKEGNQVAYLRLRHGHFTVDYPTVCSEQILSESPNGDGIFDDNERLVYMNKALKAILKKLNSEQKPERSVATKMPKERNAG